jgi:hypothetical protein
MGGSTSTPAATARSDRRGGERERQSFRLAGTGGSTRVGAGSGATARR